MSTGRDTTSEQHVKELRTDTRRIGNFSQNCFRKLTGSISLTVITDLQRWSGKILAGCSQTILHISAVNMPVSDPKSDTTTGRDP